MTRPTVTVAIPLYQGSRTIVAALKSIERQSFKDFEILIVDDGSTDGGSELIESLGLNNLRLLRNDENKGLGYTRNRLLHEATGTYVAWLDQDDRAHPERLLIQVRHMKENAHLSMIGSWYVTEEKCDTRHKVSGRIRKTIIRHTAPVLTISQVLTFQPLFNAFSTSTVMCNMRTIALNHLRFQPELFPAEDYGFWNTLLRFGPGEILPRVLSYEASGGSSSTRVAKRKQEVAVRLIRERELILLGFPKAAACELAYLVDDSVSLSELDRYDVRSLQSLLRLYCDVFLHRGETFSIEARNTAVYAIARKIKEGFSVSSSHLAFLLAKSLSIREISYLVSRINFGRP